MGDNAPHDCGSFMASMMDNCKAYNHIHVIFYRCYSQTRRHPSVGILLSNSLQLDLQASDLVNLLEVACKDPLIVLLLQWSHCNTEDPLILGRQAAFDIFDYAPQQMWSELAMQSRHLAGAHEYHLHCFEIASALFGSREQTLHPLLNAYMATQLAGMLRTKSGCTGYVRQVSSTCKFRILAAHIDGQDRRPCSPRPTPAI